jgi:hypothetical protein
MEEQTKIGTGAAAGIALMALLEPHFFEPYPKITAIIYVILGALVIWGFGPIILRFARKLLRGFRRMLWPQYLMGVAVLLFLLGLAAFLQLNVTPSKEASATDADAGLISNPLDRTVSFNCYQSARPTHFREDRPLHVVQIARPARDPAMARNAIADTYFVQGTEEIKWSNEYPNQLYRCILTNHGNAPLFRVSVELTAYWKEAVKVDNGTKSGDVFATVTARSPSLDLGVGSKNEDYFYIANQSGCYVSLPFPETANVYSAGSDVPQKIKLIPPNTPMPFMSLFPQATENPPCLPPQALALPSTPEKK